MRLLYTADEWIGHIDGLVFDDVPDPRSRDVLVVEHAVLYPWTLPLAEGEIPGDLLHPGRMTLKINGVYGEWVAMNFESGHHDLDTNRMEVFHWRLFSTSAKWSSHASE